MTKTFTTYLTLWTVASLLTTMLPDITAESFGQNNPAVEMTPDVDVVWPEFIDDNFEIFYSSESNGIWQKKIRLTHNHVADITPSVTAGPSGDVVVVWSVLDGMESQLNYCLYQNREWSKPAKIPSKMKSNMGPSVMLGSNEDVWVVWSGFDGQDDDIFISVFRNGVWDTPRQVNPENSVPDVLPFIGSDANGNPQVTWKGFDGDVYQTRQAAWDGSAWVAGDNNDRAIFSSQKTGEIDQENDEIQALSKHAQNHLQDIMSIDVQNRRVPRRAGLHIRKNNRFRSVPFSITKNQN